MKTPDITPAQIVATVLAVLGLLAGFGLDVSKQTQDAIVQVITVGFPIFLAADAFIRHGRAKVAAAQVVAAAQKPAA